MRGINSKEDHLADADLMLPVALFPGLLGSALLKCLENHMVVFLVSRLILKAVFV